MSEQGRGDGEEVTHRVRPHALDRRELDGSIAAMASPEQTRLINEGVHVKLGMTSSGPDLHTRAVPAGSPEWR